MSRQFICLGVLACLIGCASTADYSATREKDTGRVLVSYSTETPEHPPLSDNHANQVATRHCQQLGYSYTELNVHVAQQCSSSALGVCSQWKVDRAYQCAGDAIAEPQNEPVVAAIPVRGGQP